MISIKSPREIELMREAGRIVALTHEALAAAVRPGITTRELDEIAEAVIRGAGATPSFKGYGGFPSAICASANEVLVHGFPSDRKLERGDVIALDVGACYKGYHGDSAWTYAVGDVSDDVKKLMEVTRQSLFEGLSKVRPGAHLGDVSNAIQTYVESFGFSLPIDYTGHGIGNNLHEDPNIPNVGKAGTGVILRKGMCLAIEPMVQMGKPHTRVLNDGWTVVSKDRSWSAHYEHTVVVTDDGYEILTRNPEKEGNW